MKIKYLIILLLSVLVFPFVASAQVAMPTSVPPIQPMPPIPAPLPQQSSGGFIQFNNLVVQSVSSQSVPAEIIASYSYNSVTPIIPLESSGQGMSGSASVNGNVPTISNGSNNITCRSYMGLTDNVGQAIPCPEPPSVAFPNATSSSGFNSSGTTGGASGGGSGVGAPAIIISPISPSPVPPVVGGASYRIEVDQNTQLMLRDRTPTTLADFSVGDQINVFGFYNTDGSIQAYLVRDLSKPVQSQFIQLNNVNLISISSTTIPATLVVAQQLGNPCYNFGPMGNVKAPAMCPMGITSLNTNAATQNIVIPTPLMPVWNSSRKYVVNVDDQTTILDNSRTEIPLSSLSVNDQLNIYGDTNDNGQTLQADIIRDLSLPTSSVSTPEPGCYSFNTNLSIGMSGSGVTALQTALQKDGESVKITGTFDDQTASAVSGFQQKYASQILTPNGLQYGTGYAGKSTRSELNSLFGCTGGL